MGNERVTRARAAEYRIHFLQRRREIYVYIGKIWVGRIIKAENDPLHKEPGFGVYLQLPSMWGPVAKKPTLTEAKIEASAAIRRWLEGMTGYPTDPEERPEREVPGRVTRTRTATPTRVTRSRIRG